jgi:hypothetical protein
MCRLCGSCRLNVRRAAPEDRQSCDSCTCARGTDGEAHDVDAPDPRYLRADLARAVAEAEGTGVVVRSLLLRA